ncbi:MAG: glucose-methanol-choline oxidoreductase [Bdellovibrionales bacterium CG10_big_fil_rev_8_21_14_0_10_45_34]|nr:MAG: glucose-methanol-choline oxidoreductase [Bdellovibrionales bacterium CG10_big_fil_rev_8_21_14_0_10_45_34]
MSKITRRDFISDSATLALTVAATGLGCSSTGGSSKSRRDVATIVNERDEYDYIVVGSGAGGGPVASNLAKAGFRVLLLEAGGNRGGRNYSVPGFAALSSEDPDMAWNFYVKHYDDLFRQTRNPKFVEGKGILYPRAGTLGGCTAHNDLIVLYPDLSDWNQIAKQTSDPSWDGTKMRQYFERLERCRYVTQSNRNPSRHGYNGWLPTETPDSSLIFRDPKLLKLFISALAAGGRRRDANDWRQVLNRKNGNFIIPQSSENGTRMGTRELVLDTMRAHPENLVLRTGALAREILFDDQDPTKAIGIEYVVGDHLYQADPAASKNPFINPMKAFARREVILAGGVFNSPQLLMLSGIGDETELRQHNISPRIHLPGVGKNLQDRYEISVPTRVRSDFSILKDCTFGADGDPCLVDYDRAPRSSPYSTNGVFTSFIRKSFKNKSDADLCVFGIVGRFVGYYPGWSREIIAKDHFSWVVLKGKTENRSGYVKLKSKNPLEMPEINFRYFEDGNDKAGDDLKSVLEGVRYARSLNKRLLAKRVIKEESLPEAARQSNTGMAEYIKDNAWGHHASCTNPIGAHGEPGAVVDSKFRVQGAKNLRVVDASVFPRIPGLFIVASIYMIAEKASDDIIRDAGKI